MILQGILGRNFDIFAASGEFSARVLLWKTRSRPIGMRVCPVAQFAFSAFHLICVRGRWLCSGKKLLDASLRLLHLKMKEEMVQIILFRQASLMILMFLLDLVDLRHLLNLTSLQVLLVYHQDGIQLHLLLVEEKEWEQEPNCVSDCIRDLHRLDRLVHLQDGLQLHHLLVREKEWDQERTHVSQYL